MGFLKQKFFGFDIILFGFGFDPRGGGGTQHMHIWGGKSAVFWLEHCQKLSFWAQMKLKLCS